MVINLYKFVFLFLIILNLNAKPILYEPIEYKLDDSKSLSINKRIEGSHLNVFIPFMPYAYIFRLINGTLTRLNGSNQGWEYFYATKHIKIDDLTYDFELRKNALFQDASPFNADTVVENFDYFLKNPLTYTDIDKRLVSVEKINKYRIRFNLSKPYPMLLNDLARIGLYTSSYLKEYGLNDGSTLSNTKKFGLYGLGPYILESGLALGKEQSSFIELRYNPNFYESDKPYIETMKIYTKLPSKEVIHMSTKEEGSLDIAIIPFNKKVEVLTSKYAKLVIRPTRNSYSIQLNLLKQDSILQDKKIRLALNQVINQKKLIKFVYKNEGVYSPFPISSNISSVKNVVKDYASKEYFTQSELFEILNGISLNILTQDLFLELWQGIEFQLEKYNVKINYEITSDEKEVFNKLLTNRKSNNNWDMLIWGNTDWYGNHPWSLFMLLKSTNSWSAITDKELDKKLDEFVALEFNTKEFNNKVKEILTYSLEQAYMLSVPSPNSVMAINKEVDFEPSSSGILELWNAKVTPYHWSIRKDKYPEERYNSILPIRYELEN